jgi:hypothetical protein
MKRIHLNLILISNVMLGGAATARAQTEEALLDTLQHRAFGFFWSEANAANGLIRDRSQGGSPSSIASVGFGLSSICVGIDRGWVTREAGRDRVLTTLQTFWTRPQGPAASGVIGYKGFFYHFLHMSDGLRQWEWDTELSTIDTALLLAGILDTREYFTTDDAAEVQIRALADSIYYRTDWEWARNFQAGIEMGWKPGAPGFGPFGLWIGYNEAMILYVLALGSPTHPVPATTWDYWDNGYSWQTQYGQTYVNFPPLFGHQYSHCWIDFRSIADSYMRTKGISYFENSRRATLAQRGYAIANPGAKVGYSDSLWGLTASDGPDGYNARGAPPAQNDDGTITPTAPLSSIPFAPEATLPVAWKLWFSYRNSPLWGPYGFRDAFNLTKGPGANPPPWYDADYIGIDQGPIVLMIENYRTGSVWNRFMRNPDVHRGLERAGFLPFGPTAVPAPPAPDEVLLAAEPNPFTDATTVRFRLATAGAVRVTVHDVQGREVARVVDGVRPAGMQSVSFRARDLTSGVYHVRLETGGRIWMRKCVLIR